MVCDDPYMRAGRLVSLLLLLQQHEQLTARELALELEVSPRTILRDIEHLSGAGVPVYATRGRGGGFRLLEGWSADLADPGSLSPGLRRPGPVRRAKVRVTADGRRLAAVLGRLQPLRVRTSAGATSHGAGGTDDAASEPGRSLGDDWLLASFRMGSLEATTLEVLSLGPEIEVLEPEILRTRVAETAAAIARLYQFDP